jgi:hypothetical protein
MQIQTILNRLQKFKETLINSLTIFCDNSVTQ